MQKIFLIVISIIAVLVGLTYLSVSETSDDFRTCEVLILDDLNSINFRNYDSISVAANTLYEGSFLKEIVQGEQYRDAWSQPVTVPIAFLDTLKGGLTLIEEGGGKQTHSLELEDGGGIRYTLRSLSKDPAQLVPDIAKELGLENIVIDGISAQHPYAALLVSELSKELKIFHTHPTLLFVPKQASLGNLNHKYGNRLYYFEYESEGEVDWTGLEGAQELIDTDDLIELKKKDSSAVKLNHSELIKARLFDLIIGDWDRHAKQWGWVIQELKDQKIATPIPTDRDNAFFDLDGIVPLLVANDITRPKVQSFEEEIEFMPGLVREFDEYFLRTTTLEDFQREAKNLKDSLTDQTIDGAFGVWPKAIDQLDGSQLREKIKSRRNSIVEAATEFYKTLKERPQKKIVLQGCDDLELSGMQVFCFDCNLQDFE